LFLEDVNEAPYRVDAMLAQLKLTGLWDSLGGLIIGQFTEQDSPKSTSNEILAVFRDYCKDTSFPVASGLVYGHIPVKNAMPIGVRARLEVTDPEATLSILTPLVAHDR
jgi:muramoyltetrapeptide carboxypeptidase